MGKTESTKHPAEMEQWIVEARRGNRAALDQLFGACLPFLRIAAHQDLDTELRARLDASDVVQETLIEAYQDIPHFRGRTEKDLLAWLRQILHHNLANERRRHITSAMRSIHCEVPLNKSTLNQLRDMAQSEGESPAGQAQARERSEELERTLRRLPERYRQVLLLHSYEELTFAEVGKRLHCSAEAARKLWGRAAKEFAFVLGGVNASLRRG